MLADGQRGARAAALSTFLARYGLEAWTTPAPDGELQVWAGKLERPADALARWRALVRDTASQSAAVFLATEAAGVPDDLEPIEDRFRAFLAARAAPAPLPRPPWLDAELARCFADPALHAVLRQAGIGDAGPVPAPDLASDEPYRDLVEELPFAAPPLDTMTCAVPTGEGRMRVVAHEGPAAWGPLPLGWLWTPDQAAAVAALWEGWAARVGFRPVVVGAQTLQAYASRLPASVDEARAVVEELIVVCPDLAQDGAPVAAALSNVLRAGWTLRWD